MSTASAATAPKPELLPSAARAPAAAAPPGPSLGGSSSSLPFSHGAAFAEQKLAVGGHGAVGTGIGGAGAVGSSALAAVHGGLAGLSIGGATADRSQSADLAAPEMPPLLSQLFHQPQPQSHQHPLQHPHSAVSDLSGPHASPQATQLAQLRQHQQATTQAADQKMQQLMQNQRLEQQSLVQNQQLQLQARRSRQYLRTRVLKVHEGTWH